MYDRLKTSLPQFLSRHVLALEASHKDGWLERRPLAEALDAYLANAHGQRSGSVGNLKVEGSKPESQKFVSNRTEQR